MSDLIELKLVTEEEAECLHRLQVEAFMPLYEKYLSHIGSALAGSDVIDINWLTGANKFIMFGSAGFHFIC